MDDSTQSGASSESGSEASDPIMEKFDTEKCPEVQENERGYWPGKLDFALSLIGYSVSLSNFFRFPYICSRNGGGAFLIPYAIFLVLCGIPLFFLEVALGQFSGSSPLSVWNICPLFKGMGYSMVIVSALAGIYYNMYLCWILYYLGHSFMPSLPWSNCDHDWNTGSCISVTRDRDVNCSLFTNSTTSVNVTYDTNATGCVEAVQRVNGSKAMTSVEEYWQYNVLQMSDGVEEIGYVRWEFALCLLAAWTVVALCVLKGAKSVGRVVYVTALLPYALMGLFLVRTAMLPGAAEGIRYFVTPDFEKLKSTQVWIEACIQVFYSLGPAWGGLITMASYNRFEHNCLRDSVIITLVDGATSFLCGLLVFSALGFMSFQNKIPISEVITSGPGIGFIIYPEMISQLPLPQLWSVLLFVMLFTLGLDSEFGMFETLCSGIVDEFPKYFMKRRMLVTIVMAFLAYLLGLIYTTAGGMYMFQLVDWYVAVCSVILISFMECIVIAWIYGADRFSSDIEMMLGRPAPMVMRFSWCFLTPLLMLVTLIFTFTMYKPPTYGDYVYPQWAQAMGWMIAMTSVIPIPLMMAWEICHQKGSFVERIKSSLKPSENWGPGDKKYRPLYKKKQEEREARLRNVSFLTRMRTKLFGSSELYKPVAVED